MSKIHEDSSLSYPPPRAHALGDEKRIAIEEKKVSLILIRLIHAIFSHTNPRMYFMEGQMVSISIVNCPS